MKKIVGLILSAALCVMLGACTNNSADNAAAFSEDPSASAATPETEANTPAGTEEPEETAIDHPDDLYQAYLTALENLIQDRKFPDGTDAAEPVGDMSENKFAVYDVDSDGKEELLLMYINTYMAGHAGYVLAYDAETKGLKTELLDFPLMTFYDNGIIKAEWSHNQGRGMEFWPYSLYQYVPDSDSYVSVGMVDAWDKSWPGADPFPSEADKSGTGIVYYIMEDGQYDTTHPVDAADYKAWLSSYIADASEIPIQYLDLTEENISQIGK